MTLASTVIEKSTVQGYSQLNALKTILTLQSSRSQVKVNLGSKFEQTWWGLHPHCYIQRLKLIGPLVPEKKIFTGLPYMGVAAILVM